MGYDIVDHRYVINPAEAAVVRNIFEWYRAGWSYNRIIDSLNGACGKKGRPLGKIKAFFRYLEEEELLEVNPFHKLRINLREPPTAT